MGLPWRRVVEAIRLDSCHPTVGGDLVISVIRLTYPSDQHIGQAVLHGSYGLTNCIDINICIFYSWHGNLAWNHITARRLKVKVNAEIFPVSHLASFPCLFHLQFLIAWFSLCFCILQAIKNWRRTTYTKSHYCHIKKGTTMQQDWTSYTGIAFLPAIEELGTQDNLAHAHKPWFTVCCPRRHIPVSQSVQKQPVLWPFKQLNTITTLSCICPTSSRVCCTRLWPTSTGAN